MAELRRLMINPKRLEISIREDRTFNLNSQESHYLNRVLRLKRDDKLLVVDGSGHLWEAILLNTETLQILSSLDSPYKSQRVLRPLIGLAVVLPKRGFDDCLRMSCELGVDIIQPLVSDRSVVKQESKSRRLRWEAIIREAVEQSERLWCPNLCQTLVAEQWFTTHQSNSLIAFGNTRSSRAEEFQSCLRKIKSDSQFQQVWFVIGPEGGWTQKEVDLARGLGFLEVSFGESILTTSTAAVTATHLMTIWRRTKPFSVSNDLS